MYTDPNKTLGKSSLERLVPAAIESEGATGEATFKLHMERYEFARKHRIGDKILDMACGVGYGTKVLAEGFAGHVTGVDISHESIEYANRHFKVSNCNFVASDALSFSADRQFDTIVSLETIEHVPNPTALIAKFDLLLRNGGLLVASVPITPSVDANPYHLHDFDEKEFLQLLPKNYVIVDRFYQDQPFNPFAVAGKKERRTSDLRSDLMSFYIKHPIKLWLRIRSTLTHGFKNRYLTIVAKKS